jgi:NAD(P)-dependent dehydrogenase (short-subunit alcohol dehydrogenase family)
MDIKGKTALVTGAAKRIGREIAVALAQAGAHIALHYNRSKTDAQKTCEYIQAMGVECFPVSADLSKPRDISRMVKNIRDQFKTIDILVNSASLFYKTPLEAASESDWDQLIGTNLKAPFLLSKEIGIAMAGGNGGKIINIADWSGLRPYRGYVPYCVSKGGLLTLTKALARDLAPSVQVNAVAPGPMLRPPDMPEAEAEAVAKKTLLGRWGSPKDIANAVKFLIENDYINGTVLVVDGGRSIV